MIQNNGLKVPAIKITTPDGTTEYVKSATFQAPGISQQLVFYHNFLCQRRYTYSVPLPSTISDMQVKLTGGMDPNEPDQIFEMDDWDSYGWYDGVNMTYGRLITFIYPTGYIASEWENIGIAQVNIDTLDPGDNWYTYTNLKYLTTLSNNLTIDWLKEWPPRNTGGYDNHYEFLFGKRLTKPRLDGPYEDYDRPGNYYYNVYNDNNIPVYLFEKQTNQEWYRLGLISANSVNSTFLYQYGSDFPDAQYGFCYLSGSLYLPSETKAINEYIFTVTHLSGTEPTWDRSATGTHMVVTSTSSPEGLRNVIPGDNIYKNEIMYLYYKPNSIVSYYDLETRWSRSGNNPWYRPVNTQTLTINSTSWHIYTKTLGLIDLAMEIESDTGSEVEIGLTFTRGVAISAYNCSFQGTFTDRNTQTTYTIPLQTISFAKNQRTVTTLETFGITSPSNYICTIQLVGSDIWNDYHYISSSNT